MWRAAILQSKVVAVSVVTLAACSAGGEFVPNLILFNGRVFTNDAAHPYVEALAIRGEHIVATGDSAKVRALAAQKTNVVDLGGRTVIPGINDAHQHIWLVPAGARDLDLGTPDPTWSQLRKAIAAATTEAPSGTFILATIGSNIFHDPSIMRESLDRVAPSHPVVLTTFSQHAAILNSAALAKLGISEAQREPMGGKYERSVEGKLTGVLRENAVYAMFRKLGLIVSDAEALAQLRNFFSRAVRVGITSVQIISIGVEPGRAVDLFDKAPTPIRIRLIRSPLATSAGRDTKEGLSVTNRPLITVNGTKWFVDGVPFENGMTPREVPSLPSGKPPDYAVSRLPLVIQEEEIETMLRESLIGKYQLMFHTSGYPGASAILNALQATGGRLVWADRRVRFEHGDGLFPDLIPRAKEMGIVVIQNPTHFDVSLLFGPMPHAFEKSQLLRSLLAAGIPVALGSDRPDGEQMNPYLNLMLACAHPSNPPEAITREQAVTAYTLTSAFAEFQEEEKGSLKPGKLADLAVLSQDIFSIPSSDLPNTESVLTLVGGRIVYDAKELAIAW